MSTRIDPEKAREFVEYYENDCLNRGENQGEFIKSFLIEREKIMSIFEAADQQNIDCRHLRIYLCKQSGYQGDQPPKFGVGSDYSLIVVGTDEKFENISSTGEIYDGLTQCPDGEKEEFCPPSGIDF